MYEQLLHLPLFQGVSRERIGALIEKYPFHFLKFHDNDRIIEQGDECTHMRFLVSGSVVIVTACKSLRVRLSQTVAAPNVIGPDYLFGRHTQYPFEVVANGTCGILQISKNDYVQILRSDTVFLLNILNYLSRDSQIRTFSILEQQRGLVAERLARLIVMLTSRKSANIELNFCQKDFCTLLGARRTSLVNALREFSDAGIIAYEKSRITVLSREGLVSMFRS